MSDPDETFRMLAQGKKCTQCGDPKVVMISLPKAEGEPFSLEEVGQQCWCERCARLRFLKAEGKA